MKLQGSLKSQATYSPSLHLLNYDRFLPSVQRLIETPLVINGAVGSTILRFNGKDASADGWREVGGAGTLALQAGTAPTYGVGSPFLGGSDVGVKLNAGGYYMAGDTTFGGLTTEHFVIEATIGISPTGTPSILGKLKPAYYGADLYVDSVTGALNLRLRGANDTATVITSDIAHSSINHIMFFVNPSKNSTAGAQAYVNGIASGSGVNVSTIGSLDTAGGNFCLGTNLAGQAVWNERIFLLAQHQKAGWFAGIDDPAEWATIAKSRFALLTASSPAQSRGGITNLISSGSTLAAYQEKFESGATKLYYMGANSPRYCQKIDANGKSFTGMVVESLEQNIATNNTTLNGTEQSNTLTLNAAVAPDDSMTMTKLVEKTSAPQHHGRYFGGTAYNLDDIVSISGYVQAGDRCCGFGLLEGNGPACLFVVNPATGETGFATDATSYHTLVPGSLGCEYLGSNLWRVWGQVQIKYASTHYQFFGLATGTGTTDHSYAGDATTYPLGACFWGMQQGVANSHPSSLIVTAASPVTRSADNNYYTLNTGDISATEGSLYFSFWAPSFTPTRNHYLCSISASGAATNAISLFLDTNGRINLITASTGGSSQAGSVVEGSGSRCDNVVHDVLVTWQHNNLTLTIDNVLIGTDATVDVPVGLNQLRIGNDATNTAGLQAGPDLVGNIQVFPKCGFYNLVK